LLEVVEVQVTMVDLEELHLLDLVDQAVVELVELAAVEVVELLIPVVAVAVEVILLGVVTHQEMLEDQELLY
jgi:uncharacterized membrane protein YoaK (UPF0700 family)